MNATGLNYDLRTASLVAPSRATQEFLRQAQKIEAARRRQQRQEVAPMIGLVVALTTSLLMWSGAVVAGWYLLH